MATDKKYVSEGNLAEYTKYVQGMSDGETIEYASDDGLTASRKLRVKDGGISTEKIASGAVTKDKLASDALDYIDRVKPGKPLAAYSMDDLEELFYGGEYEVSDWSYMIGQTMVVSMTGIGDITFVCIGCGVDPLADGSGNAGITLLSLQMVGQYATDDTYSGKVGWTNSDARAAFNSGEVWNSIPTEIRSHIKQVTKKSYRYRETVVETTKDKLWLLNTLEAGLGSYSSSKPDTTGNKEYKGISAAGGIKYLISKRSSDDFAFRDTYTYNSKDTFIYAGGENWSFDTTQSNYEIECWACFCI